MYRTPAGGRSFAGLPAADVGLGVTGAWAIELGVPRDQAIHRLNRMWWD